MKKITWQGDALQIADAVNAYLDGKRSTLWGRAFDLSQPDSRHEATLFIAGLLAEVLEPLTVVEPAQGDVVEDVFTEKRRFEMTRVDL